MKYYIYKIVNDKNEIVFVNYTKSILTSEFNKIKKLYKTWKNDNSLPYENQSQFKQIAIKNLFNHFDKGVNYFQILEIETVDSNRETYREQKQELNSILNKMNIEVLTYATIPTKPQFNDPFPIRPGNINNKWL